MHCQQTTEIEVHCESFVINTRTTINCHNIFSRVVDSIQRDIVWSVLEDNNQWCREIKLNYIVKASVLVLGQQPTSLYIQQRNKIEVHHESFRISTRIPINCHYTSNYFWRNIQHEDVSIGFFVGFWEANWDAKRFQESRTTEYGRNKGT